MIRNKLKLIALLTIIPSAVPLRAATVTWLPTSGTNDWFDTNNWSGFTAPTNGDDVVITNNNVGALLTNSTYYFSSVLLSNRCTLVFSNWDTTLSATNVTITTNAVMTLPAAFTNDAMSNRVYVLCSNITIAAGGLINADARGYLGRANGSGFGQGAGSGNGSGGYGGRGGGNSGATYGSSNAPTDPGSSGGSASVWVAGSGGGAIRIQASGAVTIDGTITANGGGSLTSTYCGAGSGGAVYITCNSLMGSGGGVRANGGIPASTYAGGGGGRIAVIYDTNAQAQIPVPSILFQAAGGVGIVNYGEVGSLYFPDNRFLNATFQHSGQWFVPGFETWAPSNLFILSNAWLKLPADGFQLTVSNRLEVSGTVGDAYRLELSNGVVTCAGDVLLDRAAMILYNSDSTGPVFSCGGNLILTNGAALSVKSGPTNVGAGISWGALVNIENDIRIASNSVINLYSHPTNGGSALVRMRHLTIAPGGAISADGRGFAGRAGADGRGPGAGRSSGNTSAGYGGTGGSAVGSYGQTYGSSNAPVDPGSSGGSSSGAYTSSGGGGAVRVQASGTVTINGTITANSGAGTYCGTGSGGGIYIVCGSFVGSGGVIRANGGDAASTYADGGGGRIAIWRIYDNFSGTVSVAPGGTTNGAPPPSSGTVVWGQLAQPGTIIKIL